MGVVTPRARLAEVLGARVAIIAVHRRRTDAFPRLAPVVDRARAAVIARFVVLRGLKRALACRWVALIGGAVWIGGGWTLHDRRGVGDALAAVTDELAVALVAIVKLVAVGVVLAGAILECEPLAVAEEARVKGRALVAIITKGQAVFMGAADLRIADIIGADVSVVAVQRRAHAVAA